MYGLNEEKLTTQPLQRQSIQDNRREQKKYQSGTSTEEGRRRGSESFKGIECKRSPSAIKQKIIPQEVTEKTPNFQKEDPPTYTKLPNLKEYKNL